MYDIEKSNLYLLDFSNDEVNNYELTFENLKLFNYYDIVLLCKINGIKTTYSVKRNGKNVHMPKNINMLIIDLIKIIKEYDNNEKIGAIKNNPGNPKIEFV